MIVPAKNTCLQETDMDGIESFVESFLRQITGNGNSGAFRNDLCVSILNVGKADAILCECGRYSLVIDAGTKQDGKMVTQNLKQRVNHSLDCLIITHYDKDHVGGAIDIINSIPVKRVIVPAYEPSHPDAVAFFVALKQKGIRPELLKENCEILNEDLRILIEPPASYEIKGSGEYDNDFSLITTITHRNNRLVFTGDIEKKRIGEWLKTNPPACTFLKFPHHGIYDKSLRDLMKALQPEHVAICDSAKNPADKATLKLISKYTGSVYETKDGTITVISDSNGLTIHQK